MEIVTPSSKKKRCRQNHPKTTKSLRIINIRQLSPRNMSNGKTSPKSKNVKDNKRDGPHTGRVKSEDSDCTPPKKPGKSGRVSYKPKKIRAPDGEYLYLTESGKLLSSQAYKVKYEAMRSFHGIRKQALGEEGEVVFPHMFPRLSTQEMVIKEGGVYTGLVDQNIKADGIAVHGSAKCIFMGNDIRLYDCEECTVVGDRATFTRCNRIMIYGDAFGTNHGCSWILACGSTKRFAKGVIFTKEE
jgi:hypothetical protein